MKNNTPKKIINDKRYKSMPYERRAQIKKIYRTYQINHYKNMMLTTIAVLGWSGLLAWLTIINFII